MQKFLALAVLACAASAAPAADVDISIGLPGVYGRVDIGGYPQPQVYNPQPVYVQRGPDAPPPVYLYVPRDHQRDWRRYCGRYDACGQPVYFVRDDWVRDVYRPRYRDMHRDDGRRGDGRRDDGPRFDERDRGRHDERRDDRRDDRGRGDERGR